MSIHIRNQKLRLRLVKARAIFLPLHEICGLAQIPGALRLIENHYMFYGRRSIQQRFVTEVAWGTVWARPGLDRRTRHLITTPDGQQTYARIYARDFENIEGLLEYRFVLHQNAVVVAQLRVSEPSPAITEAVTQRVQRALKYPYPVRVQFVPKIEWGSWKQDYFAVSDAAAPA